MKRKLLIAPKGYVYDWATPHLVNGVEQHLYAQQLSLSRFDKEENYILVEVKKNVSNN